MGHVVAFEAETMPGALSLRAVAREAGVPTLVLSHMLEQIDQPGIREEILREMMAIYPGTIIWGEDLMVVPIRGAKMAQFL